MLFKILFTVSFLVNGVFGALAESAGNHLRSLGGACTLSCSNCVTCMGLKDSTDPTKKVIQLNFSQCKTGTISWVYCQGAQGVTPVFDSCNVDTSVYDEYEVSVDATGLTLQLHDGQFIGSVTDKCGSGRSSGSQSTYWAGGCGNNCNAGGSCQVTIDFESNPFCRYAPTASPTYVPSVEPTFAPTYEPTTSTPTFAPTYEPTTSTPTVEPTYVSSVAPTENAGNANPSVCPVVQTYAGNGNNVCNYCDNCVRCSKYDEAAGAVTLDLSCCKSTDIISWIYSSATLLNAPAGVSCIPVTGFPGKKCDVVPYDFKPTYSVSESDTSITVQTHDGQFYSPLNDCSSGTDSIYPGGCGSSCGNSGVCEVTIALSTCPV